MHSAGLQACEDCLCDLFQDASYASSAASKDASPPVEWAHWLALADRHCLRRLLPLMVEKQLRKMAVAP